jgi:hypothetical protein
MSPQAGYMLEEHIAPRIRATSRCLPQIGADDAEEMYQDGLAIAAKMLDNAEKNGKQVTAGNIAWYASKQLATGRRSTYGGRADVLSPAAQLDRKSSLAHIHQEVGHDPVTGEGIGLGDLLADTAEDPAEAAARNLDWTEMLSELDDLSCHMIVAFSRGDTMRGLKSEAGLSDSGMSARKRRLVTAIEEHLGDGCIADAGRDPAWLPDITAQREKEACQLENADW